jgi:formylglycine-generating enzyme required for sulfatase activity
LSRDEAARYCQFYEKRLPHSWEWQHAAQGNDNRRFPWGDAPDKTKVPPVSQARDYPIPDNTGAHPDGASAYGVEDLVGNLFQWTDEFIGDHSTMLVVRGGNNYNPHHAVRYYFPVPDNLLVHNTLLGMADSMDRSAGIGFRCVADAAAPPPPGSNLPRCAWQLCGSFSPLATGSARCSFSNRILHFALEDAMPLVPTYVRLKRTCV